MSTLMFPKILWFFFAIGALKVSGRTSSCSGRWSAWSLCGYHEFGNLSYTSFWKPGSDATWSVLFLGNFSGTLDVSIPEAGLSFFAKVQCIWSSLVLNPFFWGDRKIIQAPDWVISSDSQWFSHFLGGIHINLHFPLGVGGPIWLRESWKAFISTSWSVSVCQKQRPVMARRWWLSISLWPVCLSKTSWCRPKWVIQYSRVPDQTMDFDAILCGTMTLKIDVGSYYGHTMCWFPNVSTHFSISPSRKDSSLWETGYISQRTWNHPSIVRGHWTTHIGGINQCKCMVTWMDSLFKIELFGLVRTPVSTQDWISINQPIIVTLPWEVPHLCHLPPEAGVGICCHQGVKWLT